MQPHPIATWDDLEVDTPLGVLVSTVDLVVVRFGPSTDDHSVLYGRCLHRGVKLADGSVDGPNLICGVHGWDYRLDSGVSAYNNGEALHRFTSWVDDGQLHVDLDEVEAWEHEHPQPYDRSAYLGEFADVHGAPGGAACRPDPDGSGPARRAPTARSPRWACPAISCRAGTRSSSSPRSSTASRCSTMRRSRPTCVIGPDAASPLQLDIPLFVSDMSFGALSQEAKTALATGAQLAGTGICSGEGGMLPEEHDANSRYLYELASGKFGWSLDKVRDVQAFHFKFGQGAKTGTGGHLPGHKVVGRIAEVRDLDEGTDAVSPATFTDLVTDADFRGLADDVRAASGGIPIGAKLSAQHIEADIDAALRIGVDYVILDGRGGGTGAAPLVFRDNISVPTIPALARRGATSTGSVPTTSRS